MSKEQIQIQTISKINVVNYAVESTNVPTAFTMGMRNIPIVPELPAILYFKNIPKELADILEKQVMSAMTSQAGYEHFLKLLKLKK